MLKPPSSNIRWKDFHIDTPTFRITSVEKPDMSPFLFHMTSGRSLISILCGTGVELQPNNGFLKSCTPKTSGTYNAKVVCFTESPTFALDFFRYRSYERWISDQRFGIGFDKSQLVKRGVRPCVYADNQLTSDINRLKEYFDELGSSDPHLSSILRSLIEKIYPLTTPLLENEASQGYMWEREWRYTDSGGLVFPYGAIKLICCPEDEELAIKKILGVYASKVKFVRAWREYNEVTSYMESRSDCLYIPDECGFQDERDFLSILKEQLASHMELLNKVRVYDVFVESIADRREFVSAGISSLESNIELLKKRIERLNNRQS